MISFVVPGAAVGKGRPRATTVNGRARLYTPAKTANYEGLVAHVASAAMGGRPLLDGPVSMRVDIRCAVPASWSKRKRAEALSGLIRPTTKPDLDNVLKAIGDACNGVVYRDDVQIAEATVAKRYAETPGAAVTVEPVRATT